MDRFFNSDNKFFRFLGQVADLVVLNLLWIVCSLPLVTLGASTAALYYAVLKILRGEDSTMGKMFFRSFRQNLRQGVILTLLLLAAGALLAYDLWFSLTTGSQVLLAVFVLLALLVLILASYVFPVLAQFDNTLGRTMQFALLLGLRHLPATVSILILNLFPLVLLVLKPYAFLAASGLWLFLGASGIAWINAHLFNHMFAPYMPPEPGTTSSDGA